MREGEAPSKSRGESKEEGGRGMESEGRTGVGDGLEMGTIPRGAEREGAGVEVEVEDIVVASN